MIRLLGPVGDYIRSSTVGSRHRFGHSEEEEEVDDDDEGFIIAEMTRARCGPALQLGTSASQLC